MTPDFKNKTWILSDFIKFVQAKKDRSVEYNANYYYAIYAFDNDEPLFNEMIIYVGNTVEIDDNDNEFFPQIVTEMNFWIVYSSDSFQDVIDLATSQDSNVTISKLVECLNYYSEYDNFLDII